MQECVENPQSLSNTQFAKNKEAWVNQNIHTAQSHISERQVKA
jgi:hypothetical protein